MEKLPKTKFVDFEQWVGGYRMAYKEIQTTLLNKKRKGRDKFTAGYNETIDSLLFLVEFFPGRLLESRKRYKIFERETFLGKKQFEFLKQNLLWDRPLSELFLFGFPMEVCVVARVILEDTLKEEFSKDKSKKLEQIIDLNLSGVDKRLAHKIRKNGNWYSHSIRSASGPDIRIMENKKADKMAIESARLLNRLLLKWEIKRPIA